MNKRNSQKYSRQNLSNLFCFAWLVMYLLPMNVFSTNIHYPASKQTNIIESAEQRNENLVKITCLVLDNESKQPLAGAKVMVDGVSVGTSTDSNGKFMMFMKPGMKLYISANDFHPTTVVVEKSMSNLTVKMKRKTNTNVTTVVEEQASFPGGFAALTEFLSKNLIYPETAAKNGIQGRVYVEFVVNVDGTIVDVNVIQRVSPELDKEAVRVVKLMPKWRPGKINGEPVRIKATIPINFNLGASEPKNPIVEEQASFPGGLAALTEFLANNLNYPPLAAEYGKQGKVIVECTINIDGSITDIKIAQSVDPLLDKEAIRIVKLMPKWNPAKYDGKPVPTKATIPVNFKLTD